MHTSHLPVVVGIVEHQPNVLRFALEEAGRLGVGLRVVHSQTLRGGGSGIGRNARPEIAAAGKAVLDGAQRFVEAESAGVEVEYVLVNGRPRVLLLKEAESAQELVVGADEVQWVDRLLNGDVAGFVAQHAACPVVIVPNVLTPDPTVNNAESVGAELVGSGLLAMVLTLEGDTSAPGPWEFAFERAQSTGAPLHVLHSVPVGTTREDAELHGANIAEATARWAERYPDVWVKTSVTWNDPAEASLSATHSAQIVIVGRPRAATQPFAMTRPVALTVLRKAECPVAVVPAELPAA